MICSLLITFICCTHTPPLTETTILNEKIVFTGTVTQVCRKGMGSVYHFDILRAYKGVQSKRSIAIYSGNHSAGIHAQVGETWLIVSNRKFRWWWSTGICSNTGRISEVKAENNLSFLDEYFR